MNTKFVEIANSLGLIFNTIGVMYFSCLSILLFFKQYSLIRKFYYAKMEENLKTIPANLFGFFVIFMIYFLTYSTLKPDELSVLAINFLGFILFVVVFLLYNAIMNYREKL